MVSNIFPGFSLGFNLPFWPSSCIFFNAATLTLKNSSRLLETIPKNLMRSLKGTVLSAASCKTRLLNASQLMSLGIKLFFFK